MWTRFYDLHSGGGRKTPFECIYIEAEEETAIAAFTRIFDRDPGNVTCTCCGADFSVWEMDFDGPEFDYGATLVIPANRVNTFAL
jgi:hypothetical protein